MSLEVNYQPTEHDQIVLVFEVDLEAQKEWIQGLKPKVSCLQLE